MAAPSNPIAPAQLAVLDCIRRGDLTVNAISARLGVTDNAVRTHLATLEKEECIRRRGLVRSGAPGQPAAEYELTQTGEIALSHAYPSALAALVATLGERMDSRALRAVFADAGTRLAATFSARTEGSLAARARACSDLLESLGGSVKMELAEGAATLTGAGCPLAAAVRNEPKTCYVIEELLSRHSGAKATQLCSHGGDAPACKFKLVLR